MSVTMSLRKGKKFIADVCVESAKISTFVKGLTDPIALMATNLVSYVLEKIKTLWSSWFGKYKDNNGKYKKLNEEFETIYDLSKQERTGSRKSLMKLYKHRKSKKRMAKA